MKFPSDEKDHSYSLLLNFRVVLGLWKVLDKEKHVKKMIFLFSVSLFNKIFQEN